MSLPEPLKAKNAITLKNKDTLVCWWTWDSKTGETKIIALFKAKTLKELLKELEAKI